MDPPPPLPPSAPDSAEPLPWNDEVLPPVPGGKLRLMCSYGGHIMPRPHDKSLCYIGGDTRIVVVDRNSSLKDLCARLSVTLLNGRPFSLKYQLPNEDLDNLITVTNDEDLDNMIEEYDRIAAATSASPLKPSPSRLRVFLFFSKPEATASMGSLLDDAKSETWFVDALNNSGILARVVSESAAVDSFVNLDGVSVSATVTPSASSNNLESQAQAQAQAQGDSNNKVKNSHNAESSSNGSSSPSMANNLPPIRVRVDENGCTNSSRLQQDEGYVVVSSAVTMPAIPVLQKEQVVHDSGYALPPQLDQNQQQQQQQFVHASTHYIHHPTATAPVPVSSYYQVYAPPSQQQLHHPIGQQQYPVYVMPVGPAQPYKLALQSNIADSNVVASGRTLIPHQTVAATTAFKDGTPPIYPTKSVSPTMASNNAFVPIPSNQFQQQQYVGMPQVHHHTPQSIAVAPSVTTNTTTYGYEYGGPVQDQAYYTQQQTTAPSLPPQYQSMMPAAAATVLSDASKQFPAENIQQQPNRTSQQV